MTHRRKQSHYLKTELCLSCHNTPILQYINSLLWELWLERFLWLHIQMYCLGVSSGQATVGLWSNRGPSSQMIVFAGSERVSCRHAENILSITVISRHYEGCDVSRWTTYLTVGQMRRVKSTTKHSRTFILHLK